MTHSPCLYIFSGLPGSGKTTLARAFSEHLGALYLRIDTLEATLRACGIDRLDDRGYRLACALAVDNLRLGHSVITDSVNPIAITRDAYHACAEAAGAPYVDIEIECSDPDEHRRRVESRYEADPDAGFPRWENVQRRHYDPWTPPVRIDTAGASETQSLNALIGAIEAISGVSPSADRESKSLSHQTPS